MPKAEGIIPLTPKGGTADQVSDPECHPRRHPRENGDGFVTLEKSGAASEKCAKVLPHEWY